MQGGIGWSEMRDGSVTPATPPQFTRSNARDEAHGQPAPQRDGHRILCCCKMAQEEQNPAYRRADEKTAGIYSRRFFDVLRAVALLRGMLTVKIVPFPSWLENAISAPILSAIFLLIYKPRPAPFTLCSRAFLAR